MLSISINGPEGRLEAQYQRYGSEAPVALIPAPHPEAGDMNHKSAYALFRCFAERGFNTLRFNYSGVGASEGRFEEGESAISDAAIIFDWLQLQHPFTKAFYVAGISFGAWVAMQLLMRRRAIVKCCV